MKHILVAVIAVILAGCASEEHSDLRAWMADASKDLRGKVPPLPQVKPYEPVPYDVGNLLDPFKPGKIIGAEKKKEGGGLHPDMDRPKEPLEAYPLESLKYVGRLNAEQPKPFGEIDVTVNRQRLCGARTLRS